MKKLFGTTTIVLFIIIFVVLPYVLLSGYGCYRCRIV